MHIKKCKVALYANDRVLFVDPMKSISAMQHDIDVISEWCRVNGIQANTDKTRVMTFGSSKLVNAMPPFKDRHHRAANNRQTCIFYMSR